MQRVELVLSKDDEMIVAIVQSTLQAAHWRSRRFGLITLEITGT